MDLKTKRVLRRASMFLAGLTLLQPFYLGLYSSRYTVRRFNIPDSNVDLYLSKFNNSIQLGYFLAMLLVTLYFMFAPASLQRRNRLLSAFTMTFRLVCFVILLFSYTCCGSEGSLDFFYYMITISSFFFSLNQGFCIKIGVCEMPWYGASIPIAGIKIVVYQVAFVFFSKKLGVPNYEFKLVVSQTALAIFLLVLNAVLWPLGYLDFGKNQSLELSENDEKSTFFKDVWQSRGPIMCTTIGLGFIYAVYPAIVPYKLTDLESAYRIDLVFIFVNGVISLVLCLVCEFTKYGPNKNWKATNSAWKYSFLFLIPIVALPPFFILPLHYPNVGVFNSVLRSKILMATLGLIHNVSHVTLMTVGYSASGMQTESEYCGNASCFNTLFAYTVMIFIVMYFQGYLKAYNTLTVDKESWPTSGLGNFSAFFFWVGKSFVHGWRAFLSTFNTNIKSDLLTS